MSRPLPLARAEGSSPKEIGGKAASLVRLARAGFRVPEGVSLPAAWFSPWWDALRHTTAWAAFERAEVGPWTAHCAALKEAAASLECSPDMRADLGALADTVASWGTTCAVRSSSPEEDLEAASFAGGYVTVLGVPPQRLEDAVRQCFVSALDERVLVYKEQHGFEVHRPRIAVLIQRQIASEVSGVGFSLNPINNDFDEAVIDASFGLGESVVSGEVTPDHFVVDKPGRRILERRLGDKRVSRWLRPGGGVEFRKGDPNDTTSLSDAQVLELAEVLERTEELFGVPIDLEWAYAGGNLHLLQARPITAYVPLPPEMLTEPGERRRLYADRGISDGYTTNTPLATLTLDAGNLLFESLSRYFGVPYEASSSSERDLIVFDGARLYADYSQVLWWVAPERLAAPLELIDQLFARTLRSVDRKFYLPERRPRALSFGRIARVLFAALLHGGGYFWRQLLAFVSVDRFVARYRDDVRRFEEEVRTTPEDAPISRILELNDRLLSVFLSADMPSVYAFVAAGGVLESLRKRSDPETAALLDQLNRGYEGELVVEMGIEMFAMTRLLDAAEFDDLETLAKRVESRDLPASFLRAWDAFVARFGCRGPMEMDLRNPRYGDSPLLLLRQMSFLARAKLEDDPALPHRCHVAERKRAYAELMGRSGRLRRAVLRLANRWIEAYAGERDTPKHHWVMLAAIMRRNALALGAQLVAAGRLEAVGDVFHLKWRELAAAESDPEFDLQTPAHERGRFFRKVEAQVREFPHLIDSRGRILRPPPIDDDAALVGLGISPGVARGPIKVLHDPYEKEVEPGDVLVAFTTDPGWTPLFVNAAAVILQVGGVMQHGGVVAREYGKPCVAGIERALTRFEDGEIVEVDGSMGRIRSLPSESSPD